MILQYRVTARQRAGATATRRVVSSFAICLLLGLPLEASVVRVTVSPTTPVKVGTTQYQHFTATGTGRTELAVTWKVNGLVGGSAAVGTITTGGWYQGPRHIPSPATVLVSAVSVADPTKSASVPVTIIPGLPIISTPPLPGGTVGVSYRARLSAWNGTPPFTWGITIGNLPAGLSLLPSGAIVGTPTTAGRTTTTIEVIDSTGKTASRPFTIAVAPGQPAPLLRQLSGSPSSLSFGPIPVRPSAANISILPLVVTNTGNGSVTITQASTTGAGFAISGPNLPLTLAPGQNTSFSVSFDPTTVGRVTGSLSVVSNASNSPTVASLSGTGIGKHSVSLSWVASTSSGVIGYNVYRGQMSGGPYTRLNASVLTATAYTDTTVQADETYFYVTTAINSEGVESPYSNQAQAVVPQP